MSRQIEVLPGAHLVASAGGVVVVVAHRGGGVVTADSAAARAMTALLGIVRQATSNEPRRSGRTVARLATNWLMGLANGDADEVEFGVITPGDGGIAVFLHGGVTAVLSGERSEVLRGREAGFTVDRVVTPAPTIGAGVFVDEAGESSESLPARGVFALGEGTAPGAGAVLWFGGAQGLRGVAPRRGDEARDVAGRARFEGQDVAGHPGGFAGRSALEGQRPPGSSSAFEASHAPEAPSVFDAQHASGSPQAAEAQRAYGIQHPAEAEQAFESLADGEPYNPFAARRSSDSFAFEAQDAAESHAYQSESASEPQTYDAQPTAEAQQGYGAEHPSESQYADPYRPGAAPGSSAQHASEPQHADEPASSPESHLAYEAQHASEPHHEFEAPDSAEPQRAFGSPSSAAASGAYESPYASEPGQGYDARHAPDPHRSHEVQRAPQTFDSPDNADPHQPHEVRRGPRSQQAFESPFASGPQRAYEPQAADEPQWGPDLWKRDDPVDQATENFRTSPLARDAEAFDPFGPTGAE
ncbi:hypothetical protein ACFTVM_44050, partial [Nocardia sp. NPDC057030]